MRKRMEKLASQLINTQMRLTECPANLDKYDGSAYKYFLEWTDSYKIYKAFKTQAEVIDFLNEVKENDGIAYTDWGEAKIMQTEAMSVKKIRGVTRLSQKEFAEKYEIPQRTLENWEAGRRTPPDYVLKLLMRVIEEDYEMKES